MKTPTASIKSKLKLVEDKLGILFAEQEDLADEITHLLDEQQGLLAKVSKNK